MRRRLLLVVGLASFLSAAYMASPFVAAYNIRHAVKSGDSATLKRKIEWIGVRASLKSSLSDLQAQAATTSTDSTIRGMPRPPSLWTRIKAIAAPVLIESFVDRYVTPEGLSQAYAMRDTWRQTMRPAIGGAVPKAALAGDSPDATAVDRVLSFVNRIKRAVFVSPTIVELEVADHLTPERRYVSRLALEGLEWKLTSVRVVGAAF